MPKPIRIPLRRHRIDLLEVRIQACVLSQWTALNAEALRQAARVIEVGDDEARHLARIAVEATATALLKQSTVILAWAHAVEDS